MKMIIAVMRQLQERQHIV